MYLSHRELLMDTHLQQALFMTDRKYFVDFANPYLDEEILRDDGVLSSAPSDIIRCLDQGIRITSVLILFNTKTMFSVQKY